MNVTVYILSFFSLVVLVMIAVYITYKQVEGGEGRGNFSQIISSATNIFQGKLTRLVEAGRQTLSSLNMNPSSYSLVAIGQNIKRLADQSEEYGELIEKTG